MKSIVNIKNKPRPEFTLYMGRENKYLALPKSKWHNPFPMKAEKERPECIYDFTHYFLCSTLQDELYELKDQICACYCVPRVCHVHIIKFAYDHGSEILRTVFEKCCRDNEENKIEAWYNFILETIK